MSKEVVVKTVINVWNRNYVVKVYHEFGKNLCLVFDENPMNYNIQFAPYLEALQNVLEDFKHIECIGVVDSTSLYQVVEYMGQLYYISTDTNSWIEGEEYAIRMNKDDWYIFEFKPTCKNTVEVYDFQAF